MTSCESVKQGPGHGTEDAAESAASCGTDEDSRGFPVAIGVLRSDSAVDCPHLPSSAQPATAVTSVPWGGDPLTWLSEIRLCGDEGLRGS